MRYIHDVLPKLKLGHKTLACKHPNQFKTLILRNSIVLVLQCN